MIFFQNNCIIKNIKYYIFNNNYDKPFAIALGISISGVLTIILSQIISGVLNLNFVSFFILFWLILRIINSYGYFVIKFKIKREIIYSYLLIGLILLILLIGFLRKELPFFWINIIGLIDLLIQILIQINNKKNKIIFFKNLIIGLVIGLLINLISSQNFYPWMDLTSLIGMGHTDLYRDAAIVNSWKNFGKLSYGVHGLMQTPYHSLFAMFSTPFITNSNNIFQTFTYINLVTIPGLLVYGCYKILYFQLSKKNDQAILILVIIFIFLFSGFNYVQNQKSTQIATIIFLAIFPILHNFWYKKITVISTITLSFLIPLMVFARVINGLLLASLIYAFIPKRNYITKIILVISSICVISVCIFYYSNSERNTGINLLNVLNMFLWLELTWLISPWILFGIIFYFLCKRDFLLMKLKFYYLNNSNYLLVILSIGTLILLIKANGYSDIFFILMTSFYFLFFIIFSKEFFKNNQINKVKILEILNKINIKYIILGLCLIAMIYFNHLNKVFFHNIFNEIKQIRIYTGNWNSLGGNYKLLPNDNSECKLHRHDYWICNLRLRIFGVTNFDVFRDSYLNKLGENARLEILENSNGKNTAIYISPSNLYWKSFDNNVKASLFMMGNYGIPMILSINDDNENDFSFREARLNNGKLRELNNKSDFEILCSLARINNISNLLIYIEKNSMEKFIECE